MANVQFDAEGRDSKTYAPFKISKGASDDYIVQFHDWEWLFATYESDVVDASIDGYYMNGPNVEGLVKAAILSAGQDPENPGIFYNSEGDACYIQFRDLDEAVRVAGLAANMIKDRGTLLAMIRVSQDQGFDDG